MLIAGIGVGWLLHGGVGESGSPMSDLVQVESDGRTVARGPLSMALDNLPSGRETILPFAAGKVLRVAVKLSFRNHAQDYCRQYEAGLAGSENFGGIACNSNGQWNIKLQAQLAPARPSAGRTAPAGSKSSALEAAVMSWIDGDALDQQDEDATDPQRLERALIARCCGEAIRSRPHRRHFPRRRESISAKNPGLHIHAMGPRFSGDDSRGWFPSSV